MKYICTYEEKDDKFIIRIVPEKIIKNEVQKPLKKQLNGIS